ncbi:MAG: hypothetical protein QXU13_01000 [Desulfurococcaceae archaeon]
MERRSLLIIAVLVVLLIVTNVATYFITSGAVTTITQFTTVLETRVITQTVTTRETVTVTVTGIPSPTPTPTPTVTPTPTPTTPAHPTPPPPIPQTELASLFPEPVTIVYWDGLTGGDGWVFDEIIKMFHEYSQGFVKVERTAIGWADLFARLVAIWRAGDIESLPHLLMTHTDEIPLMKPFLAPMDDLLRQAGFTKEMFDPISWERCVWDGKVLCLPWDIHPMLLYFRIDVAQEYGIRIPPPACEVYNLPCWDRPLEKLSDVWDWFVKEVKPKLPANITPTGWINGGGSWEFWGLVSKNVWAGKGTDEDPQPEFDGPEAMEVYRFLYEGGRQGIIGLYVWPDLANCLVGGQVFTWYHGPWMMATFDTITGGCPYGAIPLLKGVTWYQLHTFEITVRAQRDPKVLKAIEVFFRYIYQPDVHAFWGIRAGHVPTTWAAQPVYIGKAKELVGDLASKAREMWSFQVFQWGGLFMPHHPLINQINDILNTYTTNLVAGVITPEEAARSIQQEMISILEAWRAQIG